jgi:endonuclease-8
MPEGHTLHRLAGLHQEWFSGRTVEVSSPQGRFAPQAERVDGRVLARAHAYGKHLFHVYGPDAIVHVHLGLIGEFTDYDLPEPPVRGQVRLRMLGESKGTDLRGPTICELLTEVECESIFARLGPDPLRGDAEPDLAFARINRSRLPISALLLDQKILAGVGNVYRAEVLFRHGIDPLTPGKELGYERWLFIWSDLVELMADGVRKGRIDTVLPEHEPETMGRSARVDRHGGEVYVYRRGGQPCLVCGSMIRKADLMGRNLFWCPTCQP